MLDNLDLDIGNYDLNDILKLFHINNEITDEGMKQARKIVAMTHPDKAKIDKKYFLFFQEAYKLLNQVYNFKKQSENTDRNTEMYNAQLYKLIQKIKN